MSPTCGLCPAFLTDPESIALRRCFGCRQPPAAMRAEAPPAAFVPAPAPAGFALALADRIYVAYEILAHKAERRPFALTEVDYPLE